VIFSGLKQKNKSFNPQIQVLPIHQGRLISTQNIDHKPKNYVLSTFASKQTRIFCLMLKSIFSKF